LLAGIFRAPRPPGAGKVSAAAVTLASGDQAVFVVSEVQRGVAGGTPEIALVNAQRAQAVASQAASAEFSAYLGELERTAKVTRNDKVFGE
jgi:hypothetical protein